MEQRTIRPRITLAAFRWDGQPVAGFRIVPMSLDTFEPLAPTLLVGGRTVAYARPGDWIVTGPCGPFVVADGEFLSDYEILP